MSLFQPSRASPPRDPVIRPKTRPQSSRFDLTASSATSVSSEALGGLSSKDVQLIEDIIQRAPPSTTTFLNVFKAYNEVLQERGLDSGNDVVYYKILLKIGVVRGKDWGAKWNSVKEQFGYVNGTPTRRNSHETKRSHDTGKSARSATSNALPVRSVAADRLLLKPNRSFPKLTTAADVRTDRASLNDDISDSERTSSPRTLVQRPSLRDFMARTTESNDTQAELPIPAISEFIPVRSRPIYTEKSPQASSSVISADTAPVFPSLNRLSRPSVNNHALDQRSNGPFSRLQRITTTGRDTANGTMAVALNEEDAWRKVRLDMDEKYADDIYAERLLDGHYLRWRNRMKLTRGMAERADDRRRLALLKVSFCTWQSLVLASQNSDRRLARLADMYAMRRILSLWRKRLSLKRAREWKIDMKERFRYFRRSHDKRILKDALTLWRQQYRLRFADQFHEHNLSLITVKTWCRRLRGMQQMELQAEDFGAGYDLLRLSKCLQIWRGQLELRAREKIIYAKVQDRIRRECLYKWLTALDNVQKGEDFHDQMIMRRFLSRWKTSYARLQNMQVKADRQKRRGDKLLVRVLLRIWIAKERGNLLLNVTNARSLHAAFAVWRQRTLECGAMTIRSEQFASRPSSAVLVSALGRWHNMWMNHRKVYLAAMLYDKQRFFMYWRVRLRQKLELVRRAKFARKYLLLCNAWKMWVYKLDERRRLAKLQMLEAKMLSKYLAKWQQVAARERYHRQAMHNILSTSNFKLLRIALDKWTNRVIEIKDRELEYSEARKNMIVLKYLKKWKDTWRMTNARHSEEVSLMRSYQDIKEEEMLRRIFHRWQTAFKKARYHRTRLQEHELQIVADAWDKWQERLQAERLKPLEYGLMVHIDTNRLFRTFVLWHSKTKSTLAVRFFASNTRLKFWNAWRNAMPKALQARKAREKNNKALQARVLDKWVKAYRTKIALKAVARARFLRLPSGLPRQQPSLMDSVASVTNPLAFPSSVRTRLRSRERSTPSASSARDDRLTRASSQHSQYDTEDNDGGNMRDTASAPSIAAVSSNIWTQLRRTKLGRTREIR